MGLLDRIQQAEGRMAGLAAGVAERVGGAITSELGSLVRRYLARPSGWRFDTSAGIDLSAGIGAASVGAMQITQIGLPAAAASSLFYSLGGGTAGFTLPGSFDVSLPQMPSDGRIYRGPAATGAELSRSDFHGAAMAIAFSAQALYDPRGASLSRIGPGRSLVLFFLGAVSHLQMHAAQASVLSSFFMPGAPMPLPTAPVLSGIYNLIAQFKALAVTWGANQGIGAGVGMSFLSGGTAWTRLDLQRLPALPAWWR